MIGEPSKYAEPSNILTTFICNKRSTAFRKWLDHYGRLYTFLTLWHIYEGWAVWETCRIQSY